MSRLIINVDKEYPLVHNLRTGKTTVGRSKDNDIILKLSSVSAYHAEFILEEDGVCKLEDADSQNGTFVNGELVKNVVLTDGDKFKLGSIKGIFESPQDDTRDVKSLMRKSEIEKNNLKLIENDTRMARFEMEKAKKRKRLMQEELDHVMDEVETNKIELLKNKEESEKLSKVIAEAKAFKEKSNELQIELNTRTDECKELSRKITAGEKLYAALDLENSIKEKKKLTADIAKLTEDREKSKADFEAQTKKSEADFKEKIDKLEEEQEKFKAAFDERCRKEEEESKEKIRQLEEEQERKKAEFDEQCKKDQAEFAEKIEKAKAELAENERKAKEAEAVFEKARQIEAGIGEKETELQNRSKDVEELDAKISAQKQTLEEYETKVANSREELEKLHQSIEEKSRQVEELGKTIQENEAQISAAAGRLEEIETNVRKGQDDVSQSLTAVQSLQNESLTLNRILGEKAGVLQRLKSKISSRGSSPACPPLRLINPGMSSLVHYFHHGAGVPGEDKFAPVGHHAFAACTRGSMHRDADSIMSGTDPVFLLLTGDIEKDRELIASVAPGTLLLVNPREGQFRSIGDIGNFFDNVSGIVCTDSKTAKILDSAEIDCPKLVVPVPSPIENPDWDFSKPAADRSGGILLYGEGFDFSSALHRNRLELINRISGETNTTVTLCQQNNSVQGLNVPGELLKTADLPGDYIEYLRLAADHRFITGFGKNFTGGDITGDAVMVHSVFLGADAGDSVEQLLFPGSAITGDTLDSGLESARPLFTDASAWLEAMEHAQSLGTQLISFESICDQLGEFIHSLSGG